MDFGAMGLDNLVCSNSASNNGGCFASGTDADVNKHRLYGSGFLKQESRVDEDDLRAFKQAKTAETMTKIPLQGCNDGGSLTESHQQMLSFSSPNSQMLSFSSHSSQPVMFPFYHHASSAINRSSGFGSGGVNAASMQEVLSVVRGPFTPSQWMELEHQALIYKYITANVPIPSYLLNPIRKALESSGFSCFSVLRPNAYLYHKYERRDVKIDMVPWNGKWTVGWGAFHLGFSNTDPEPGRCRRTDGKKWRCSRDAVADQKYCERHMNRGRHRSRKPVEGQSGHSASGITTTNGKSTPMASSMSMSVVPANGASKSLSLLHHQQLNNLQHGSNSQLSGKTSIDRSLLDKKNATGAYQHAAVLSMSSPKISFKDNEQNAYIETSRPEFGSVCSDSLLNPLNSSSSLVNSRNYGNSDNLSDHESKSQHALRQFIDDWPKNQSARSSISWPDVDLQADSTQLSISIPVVTSDFMSSTASPTNEKLTASPLRLSREVEATQMGLGVGAISIEQSQKQNSWVSVSWEPSIGGPLGEALHTTSNSTSECKNAKALNLIENWDNSPRLASSSFGLLRGSYGSVSNSSAGSSPRAESSKTLDGASFCNGLIGPGLMLPSLPAL